MSSNKPAIHCRRLLTCFSGTLFFDNLGTVFSSSSILFTQRGISPVDCLFGRSRKFLVLFFFEQEVFLLEIIQVLLDRDADAKNILADLVILQFMLMDSVLALNWVLSFLPFCVRVPCHRIVVPETTG